jgi:hypothetical protein
MSADNECNGLLIVHCHPRKRLRNIACRIPALKAAIRRFERTSLRPAIRSTSMRTYASRPTSSGLNYCRLALIAAGSAIISAIENWSRWREKASNAPDKACRNWQLGVITQVFVTGSKHSTKVPVSSILRTTTPTLMSLDGRASRKPPVRPRAASTNPSATNRCATFIRWFFEMP